MSEVALRYIETLRGIPRKPRKATSASLQSRLQAAGFQISLRTVQRDLRALSRIFPIASDEPAKPAGWWWAGPVVDVPALDPHTALTFLLVEQFIRPLLPKTTLTYLAPYFDAARNVLKTPGRNALGRWPDRVRVLPRGLRLVPADTPLQVVSGVYQALLEGQRFRVAYRPRGKAEETTYDVNPLGLVLRGPVVYLVCTLWNYQDVKHLALHRMHNVEVLGHVAQRPAGFTMDEYLSRGDFGYKVSDRRVRLEFLMEGEAAQHLLETPMAEDQRVEAADADRLRIRATVDDSNELRWWLLGFGPQIEVVKPKGLRSEIKGIAEETLRRYQPQRRIAKGPRSVR